MTSNRGNTGQTPHRRSLTPEQREAMRARREQRAAQRAQTSQTPRPRRSGSAAEVAPRSRRATAPEGTSRARRSSAAPARRSAKATSSVPSVFGVDIRLLGAAVLLLLAIVLVVRGCTSGDDSATSTPEPMVVTPAVNVDEYADQVYSWLEDEYAEKLLEAARVDEDTAWIVSHIDEYGVDGDAMQYRLLKLAALEPQARPFVRNFPELYPAETASAGCEETWEGRIPRLYQWDMRWGYTVYCSTAFAATGCCPTSFAMVYQGLTGKNDMSPYDMGRLADDNGYMLTYDGTSTEFLIDCADELGLDMHEIPNNYDSIVDTLNDGYVIIDNVGPGDFTSGGHFIVLAGLDENGDIIVNDPYSAERSSVRWSVETISNQTKLLYAYCLS